jgi:hypothetical protein
LAVRAVLHNDPKTYYKQQGALGTNRQQQVVLEQVLGNAQAPGAIAGLAEYLFDFPNVGA